MNPQQPASMGYSSSSGSKKTFLIILLTLLVVAFLAFGVWAFTGRQDYKNKSDVKAAAAVEAAKQAQAKELQTKFYEQSKSPYKTFKGSATYGSVSFDYPKVWSAYVETSDNSQPINAYFHPNEVPGIQSKSAYALRVELVNSDYTEVVKSFDSDIADGKITAKAYLPPKMQGVSNVVPGTYFTGAISSDDDSQSGALVAIKVRDKTLKIYTESTDFLNDFNTIILPSLIFSP